MPEQELSEDFVDSVKQKFFKNAEKPCSGCLKVFNSFLNFFNLSLIKNYDFVLIDREFKKLKNADYRHKQCPYKKFVRELNFNGKTVVIKKVHASKTGKAEIQKIQRIVNLHNRRFNDEKDYLLCMPFAFDLGFKFILMSKSSKPTLEEIFGTFFEVNGVNKNFFKSKKGKLFFDKIQKEHGVTKTELRNAFLKLNKRTKIRMPNVFLLGYKKEKFLFMPLVDLG